ncbi:MAG: glycosyltransferase family 4 protein [Candidatus Levybacteria bacterium]|nr:glycosyltransferase family 4 protein [Candidatus Levybacteria bacterium]
MRKLRIHVINKYFYPVTGGGEVNIQETHKHFLNKGWTVTVHSSQDTLTEKNVLAKYDEIEGIKIMRYPYRKFGFFPRIDWNETDVISLHNFNIFPHFQIMLYVIWLKLLKKKKFIFGLTPHGGFNPEWITFGRLAGIIKKIYHYTVGVVLINASLDIVRAVSEWEHDQLVLKGVNKKKVVTLTNGIENEAYLDIEKLASKETKEKIKSYGKYILQVGRIHPIKNYEITIKALVKLKDINYLIVGPDQDLQYKLKLKNLIKKLKLDERVKFLGSVTGIDKFYIMKNAELMVHMASWESFCNVVHEGMSQGLVCIVSDRTALPHLVKDGVNGYCLDVYDDEALAKKIKFVLENKNSPVIKGIKKRNIQLAKDHTWENVSKEVERFYLNLYKSI